MSVRGYSAEVERFEGVKLTGLNQVGTQNELALSGWNTNVVSRCEKELAEKVPPTRVDQVISNYFKVKSRLRKGSPYETDNISITSSRIGGFTSPRQKKITSQEYYFE